MKDWTFQRIEERDTGPVAVFRHLPRTHIMYLTNPGGDPVHLTLEETETAFNLESLRTRIKNLRDLGIDTAEDVLGLRHLLIRLALDAEARGNYQEADEWWDEHKKVLRTLD